VFTYSYGVSGCATLPCALSPQPAAAAGAFMTSANPLTAAIAARDAGPAPAQDRDVWRRRYRAVREATVKLCAPLETEDYVVQSMPDASPAKWHLAHTTWFFETFVLGPGLAGFSGPDPVNAYLFNSYYNAVGPMHCRSLRGMISRPTVAQTYQYREQTDERMARYLAHAPDEVWRRLEPVLELGLQHEQQHQELLLTDVKHMLAQNPLRPVYRPAERTDVPDVAPLRWISHPEGMFSAGHEGAGFHFDNEAPRHRVFTQPFQIASRLVTNGEYLQFMAEGGYERPELWLSLGWATVREQGWRAPLYWENKDGGWQVFTLRGVEPVNPAEPVTHVSYFEADAFARWAGARLPTEQEWERVAEPLSTDGNFVEAGRLHPAPAAGGTSSPAQVFGDTWEWTQSAYSPYPGYRPPAGAIGEYNGKFMCNQYVLRGGSCATPGTHIRPTYRNFFPPEKRWQFTGIRLARDGT
jgi:ergothioneine biosynthesis protein EgtB